jgi:hypothetical protein
MGSHNLRSCPRGAAPVPVLTKPKPAPVGAIKAPAIISALGGSVLAARCVARSRPARRDAVGWRALMGCAGHQ